MKNYLNLLQDILENGTDKTDRTGVGTRSVFGRQLHFPLQEGFPLLTTKKVHLKSIIYELLWFLQGNTNIGYLNDHGVTIWDEWADAHGDLGPVYGKQWRSWQTADGQAIDQMTRLVEGLKTNPDEAASYVSAWNVEILSRWLCIRDIRCSSFTWRTGHYRDNFTNAVPIYSWAFRSILPRTRC